MKLRRPRTDQTISKGNVLPLTINRSGKCEFESMFNHKTKEAKDEYDRVALENSIFGRKLKGKDVSQEVTFQVYDKEMEEDINLVYKGKKCLILGQMKSNRC